MPRSMEHKTSLLFEVERDSTQEAPIVSITTYDDQYAQEKVFIVRLDKWLWAARCFKTLALARAAIEQGKVFYDGQKTLPSREIEVGANLVIQQGKQKRFLIIKRLLTRRRSIDENNPLFEELIPPHHTDLATSNYMPPPEKRQRRTTRFLRRSTIETG